MACTAATVVVLLLMVAVQSISATESHFETYPYYAMESRQKCEVKSSEICGEFLIWKACYTIDENVCTTVVEPVLRQGTRCQTGWSSSDCNVPICSTLCIGGRVCTAPDTCECMSTGGGCQSLPCSADMNCYPGSCIGSTTCSCPSGFSGANCLNIDKTPDISVCQVQLYNSSTALFKEVTCEAPGTEPQTTTWISVKTLSIVQVKWTSTYVEPFSLPDHTFAPYVQNAPVPIGVSGTGFSASIPGTSANIYTGCSAETPSSPQGTVSCEESIYWVNLGVTPVHNQTFVIIQPFY